MNERFELFDKNGLVGFYSTKREAFQIAQYGCKIFDRMAHFGNCELWYVRLSQQLHKELVSVKRREI